MANEYTQDKPQPAAAPWYQPQAPAAQPALPSTPAPAAPAPSTLDSTAKQAGYDNTAAGGMGGMDIPGLPSGFVSGQTPPGSTSPLNIEDPYTALQQAASVDVPY